MSIHFIGVDAGGTQTRAMLATAAGNVIGTGSGDGANHWSSGTSAAGVITGSVRSAVRGVDPATIVGGVIAMAGSGVSMPDVVAEIAAGWRNLKLSGSPEIVPDVLAAYAAGTVGRQGVVLVAGTGSIAAAISDGMVQRSSGGHGWLLGDEGSAVWLGLRGTQAALRALDGRGPQTRLATTIPAAFDIHVSDAREVTTRIVAAVYGRPPAQLGQLAPMVNEAAELGDPVAQELVAAAADHLTGLVAAVIGHEQPPVIVLAGSLLTKVVLIKRSVRARLADRWPASQLAETDSGVAGAVALAIGRYSGRPIVETTLARLRGGGEVRRAV